MSASRWHAAVRILWLVATLLMLAGPAYAHGDMAGPAELGPPLVVSGTLAVISYWVVMLWPRRPEDEGRDRDRGDDRRGGGGRPKDRPINGNGVRMKVVKVKTEDRVSVLMGGGPDESEGKDHEERYATHFTCAGLHRSSSSVGIRARRGW